MAYKKIMIGYNPAGIANISDLISSIYSIAAQHGGSVSDTFTTIPGMAVTVPEEFADAFMRVMKGIPGIQYVYPEVEYHLLNYYTDTMAPEVVPWGVEFMYAPAAHAAGNIGQGVKVGIIDTGIDYNHPDLKNNFKGGYNVLNDTNNPVDENGHGTHVAGTIGANGRIIGVAPGVSLYSIKVFGPSGSTPTSVIIKGIEWCNENGMNIISMSLGGPIRDPLMEQACNAAYNAGILVVAAAGNSGGKAGDCTTNTIGYPALYPSVVAVTALQCDAGLAYFSSRGPKAEITAPGRLVYSTYHKPWGVSSIKYRTLSGTSMACPHVSGAAALVWAANPGLTNVQLRERLDNATIDLGGAGRDGCFGFGTLDLRSAVSGTVPPQVLPPAPTAKHTVCYSDIGCGDACGIALADECTPGGNCLRCDDSGTYFSCVPDMVNGKFKNGRECVAAGCAGYVRSKCLVDHWGRYRCQGVISSDPDGIPTADCEKTCVSGMIKYKCSGAPDYACAEDPAGTFNSMSDCTKSCRAGGCTAPPISCSFSMT